jgi:osmotically-inducible protein OsmY
MTQSAGLKRRRLLEIRQEEKAAPQVATQLETQRLEDLRLAQRVEHALRATGYGALRAVAVSVNARLVVLLGRVPCYYFKQIAQTVALAVPGAHRVHNNLIVIPPA